MWILLLLWVVTLLHMAAEGEYSYVRFHRLTGILNARSKGERLDLAVIHVSSNFVSAFHVTCLQQAQLGTRNVSSAYIHVGCASASTILAQ